MPNPPVTPDPPPAPVPPAQVKRVDDAREKWASRLIDVSRRNNLLYFRDLKSGSLDLSNAPPETLAGLFSGGSVAVAALTPGVEAQRAAAVAIEISRRALANLEEKGIQTLFVAVGLASWTPGDGGRPADAAVILLPVTLDLRGRDGRNAQLKWAGAPQINLALLHVLSTEFGTLLTAEDLLAGDAVDDEDGFDWQAVIARLAARVTSVPGFSVRAKHVLSNFSFQKMAMVRDLKAYPEQFAAHPVIAALAGDPDIRKGLAAQRNTGDGADLERKPLDQEFLILDADSSQQRVVDAVAGGRDGVIQGPPGTGKSQTIVNMIASLAAKGKRVLFVAEKRAALQVVKDRLERSGLGHLALDLHGADISQRALMQRVAQALSLVRDSLPVDAKVTHEQLAKARDQLNGHVARLHQQYPAWQLSAYDLMGRALRTPPEQRSKTRWRGAVIDGFDAGRARQVEEKMREAAGLAPLVMREGPTPWAAAELADGAAAQTALDAAAALAHEALPALRAALARITTTAGLTPPATLNEARATLGLLRDAQSVLDAYHAEIFTRDPAGLALALQPARQPLKALWARLTNAPYREAARTARTLRRDPKAAESAVLGEVVRAAQVLDAWRKRAAQPGAPAPATLPDTTEAALKLEAATAEAVSVAAAFPGMDVLGQPLDVLLARADWLAADAASARQVPRARLLERELIQAGAAGLLAELRESKAEPATWAGRFRDAWERSCLERIFAQDPQLAGFVGITQNATVARFQTLDRERAQKAVGRVRRAHAERAVQAMNDFPEQNLLVRREAEKRSRHLPLRRLLAQAPDVLTALFPCWMASPLAVSQLLDGERRYFDVVIFDEASQVLPEDAVCAILRAEHAVVAGDKHQLPPTTFFAAGEDTSGEAEDDGSMTGFESVLDQMQSFLEPWMLEWHYRSQDESLIAFSNHHIYGDRLVTFPGARSGPALQHVLVPAQPENASVDSSSAEALRVVELVLEHARARPDESLGVIALGITHALRIQAALDQALAAQPELEPYFDEKRAERFFIKNLERVQGDERDAIILSVGYTKDANGRLPYRFGPLLFEGGERRLNVAITRARRRLTLVSSFDETDMDPARSNRRGVELLRDYIQFARNGGVDKADGRLADVGMNAFEADVYDALTARGVRLLPQWGTSRYRIDFAAQHPAHPGQFVLAVECDGASYHSAPTARDRDRLRQQQLEALGWRFLRIWSTDWFLRREQEIERAVAAYEAAVRAADVTRAADDARVADAAAPGPRAEPAPAAGAISRAARPNVPQGLKIDAYDSRSLAALARWVMSDGKMRTDDELVAALMDELGFKRHGARIDMVLGEAIRAAKAGR